MRLSEAILLGDSLRKRNPCLFLSHKDASSPCGCALGGANLAAGGNEYFGHRTFWPWLKEISYLPSHGARVTWENAIGIWGVPFQNGINFYGVCEGTGTIEQLADAVRSVEPSCGDCNQFECTCSTPSVRVLDPIEVTA